MIVRLSIITVCRNEETRIVRTMDSVVGQTVKPFEYIVIDGGSTDGTTDIIRARASTLAHFASEPDNGIYDAMNKGLRAATGDYCLFLNAGDYLYADDVVERVLGTGLSDDILVGDIVCENPESGQRQFKQYADAVFNKHFFYDYTLPHQATFIRRSLFDTYGDYDPTFRIAADHDLFTRLIVRHGVLVRHVPITVSVYLTGGVSARLKAQGCMKPELARIRRANYPLAYRLYRRLHG